MVCSNGLSNPSKVQQQLLQLLQLLLLPVLLQCAPYQRQSRPQKESLPQLLPLLP